MFDGYTCAHTQKPGAWISWGGQIWTLHQKEAAGHAYKPGVLKFPT